MDDRCHLRRQGYAGGGYPVLRFLAIAKGDNRLGIGTLVLVCALCGGGRALAVR